jgi:hypothetical protein
MDGNKELPIGEAADTAVHGAHEAGPPPPVAVYADEFTNKMFDASISLTKAYAAYIRARQVYVVDKDPNDLLQAQDNVIAVMREVVENLDKGAALTLGDSVIEVQFEVLSRLGMI